ncbi:hypothetical protein ABIF54_003145 [Bradyrhizobium japonicum]
MNGTYSPFHPQARSFSCMCGGAGATTRTGSLFREIGTTISRECRCSFGSPKRGPLPVNVIAEDRPAGRGRMHPQLMGPPRHRFHGEPGETVTPAHHLPVGDRLLAFGIGLLPPAALGIEPAERHIDGAFVLGGPAFDHGPVGLADLAVLEQQAERGGRLAMAAEDEATGGVLVQPVGQHRRPRQAETERVEGCLQIGAALGAAMHRQTGRLVDDQHQSVAMEHAAQDFVGGQFGNIEQWQDFRSRLSFGSRNG